MGLFSKEGSSKSSKSDAPLRKSDRRKLRQTVELKLLFLSSSDENGQMQQLLDNVFLGNANILVRKVKLPASCTAVNPTVTIYYRGPSSNNKKNYDDSNPYSWPYQSANMPIIMEVEDGNKKSFIVPTVSFMSIVPIKLPSVVIPSVVSKYICRGADLMRSGIIHVDQNCRPLSLVSVYVHNNPQPFAVGFLTKDTNTSTVGPSSKGVAVEILTCYGDDLSRPYPEFNDGCHNWMGGGASYGNGNFGNVGFVDGKLVHSLKTSTGDNNTDSDSEEENDEEPGEENLGEKDDNTTSNQGDVVTSSNEPQSQESKMDDLKLQSLSITNDLTPGPAKEQEEESQVKNDSGKESSSCKTEAGEQLELSQDEILLQAFHNALLSISPKTDLPIAVSTFYSKFVLPSRPPNTTIHMKETTFQKFGAFLLYKQQNSQIIKVKGNGSDPIATIVAVNRNHIDLREAKQRRKSDANSKSSNNNSKSRLAVIQLYIIQPHIAKLMRLDDDVVKAMNAKSESRKGTGFLTAPECRGILETYVTAESLIQEDDPEYVSLDGPLTDILFRKQRKKKQPSSKADDTIPSVITRKEMNSLWMESLEKGFAFVQMPGSKIMTMKRGSPPAIHIEVEARTKKKFITRVRGLEHYFIDPSTFANDVSKRLACASSTEELISSTKQKSTQVEFQGHIVEELTALLLGNDKISSHGGIKDSPYNVPKGVISLNLRKGVPTKKKR